MNGSGDLRSEPGAGSGDPRPTSRKRLGNEGGTGRMLYIDLREMGGGKMEK